jgi:hypothetical protein
MAISMSWKNGRGKWWLRRERREEGKGKRWGREGWWETGEDNEGGRLVKGYGVGE